MRASELFSLALLASLAENLVLSQGLGSEALLTLSGKRGRVLPGAAAMTALMTLLSVLSWLVREYVLAPLGLGRLLLLVQAVILGLLCLGLEALGERLPGWGADRAWMAALGVNGAVLGCALLVLEKGLTLPAAALYGLFSGLGFLLVSLLLSQLRERLRFSKCPKAFEGLPILLVAVGLVAMIFTCFRF